MVLPDERTLAPLEAKLSGSVLVSEATAVQRTVTTLPDWFSNDSEPTGALCSRMGLTFSGISVGQYLLLFGRFVDAEWLFIEIVAGGGKGARAASHANVAELAATALAFQVVDVAQLIEYHRVFPDIGERLLFQIPGQSRQISTGINLALMRNETDGGSGQASLGHGVHVGRMSARMSHGLADAMRFQFDAG